VKRVNCLTDEQLDKLLKSSLALAQLAMHSHRGRRYHIMTLLMCDAGLRIGEVRKLLYSDLYYQDIPVSSIIVRAEIAKGGTSRTIPVSPRLNLALVNAMGILKHISLSYNSEAAFMGSSGRKWMTARAYQIHLSNLAMASIGFHISPHTLRHTFADRLRQVTDIRTVQVLMGHKNLSSTQIYTHPNDKDKSEAIAKICKKSQT